MSDLSLTFVLQFKTSKIINDTSFLPPCAFYSSWNTNSATLSRRSAPQKFAQPLREPL